MFPVPRSRHFFIKPTQQPLSFSHNSRTDSATFQWTAHPSFHPRNLSRKPIADSPAGSAPSVLPPLDTSEIPLSQLLVNCIMALAPGLVVPTPPPQTDTNLPYYSKIALLSEAELSRLLPETDPSRLPHLQKFAAIYLNVAVHNLP